MGITTDYSGPNGDLGLYFDSTIPGSQTTGYKLANGTDIGLVFTNINTGFANANASGYNISTGADLNTLFAANGTAGNNYLVTAGAYNNGGLHLFGYDFWVGDGVNIGSMNTTNFKSNTIASLVSGGAAPISNFFVSTTATNPGQNYIDHVIVGGNVAHASQASYSYSSGNAHWTWVASSNGGIWFPTGTGTARAIVG